MDIQKIVGANIKRIRIEKNMSREFLASAANVGLDSIGNYERGDTTMKLTTLFDIAEALEVDPGTLISDARSTMLWKYENLNEEHKIMVRQMIDICRNDEHHKLP